MPSLFDLLHEAQQSGAAPQQPAPESSVGDEFNAGLRSGALGIGANVEALAGDVGDAVGATDFATNRRKAMREYAGEAQQGAPRVGRASDVHSMRDAVDYGAGLAGGMVPAGAGMVAGSVLGGLATGGNPLGAIAGGAAALTPIEAGDVAQRQQADPEAAQRSAGERLARDVGVGGASALLQTAVPGAILGRIAGGAAGKVAGAGLRDAFEAAPILPRVAGEVAAGTGGMVGGEAAKQVGVNSDKPLDTDALTDTAVSGALGMLPLAGLGAVASGAGRGVRATGSTLVDGAKAGVQAVKDGAQSMADSRVGKVADTAGEALGTAKTATMDFARDPATAVKNAASAAQDLARSYWTKIAKGDDTLTPEEAAQPDHQAAQAEHDTQRASAVKDAFDALVQDKSLSPDVRQKLMAAGQDLGDRVNQSVVASVKLARDTTQGFLKGVQKFASDSMAKADASRDGVKASADESGLYAALKNEVIPVLQEQRPDLMLNDGAINDTAKALRNVIQRTVTGGEFTDAHVADLLETFGDATLPVMEATHRAVFGSGSQATDEAFFGLMNRLHDTQASHANLVNVLRDSATSKSASDTDLSTLAWKLKDWARDYHADDAATSAKKSYADKQVLSEMDRMFGGKASAVLDAVQKSNAESSDNVLSKPSAKAPLESDEGHEPSKHAEDLTTREEGGVATHYYGTGDDRTGLVLNPEHPDFAGDKAKNQVTAAMERAKADHPDKTVSFMTADELGGRHPAVKAKYAELTEKYKAAGMDEADAARAAAGELKGGKHGMVVAEGEPTPGQLTSQDVNKNLLLVQKKGDSREHPARMPVDTGTSTRVLDAMKLTRKMHNELPYEGADDKSRQHRMGRMFMEGVAALSDRLGKPVDPADSTVISKINNKDFTYGEAKKLDYSPRNERAEKLDAELVPYRKAYKEAKADGDTATLDKIHEEVAKLMQFHKDAELSADPQDYSPAQFDKSGNLTHEGLRMLMEGDAHGGGDAGGRTRHTDSVDEDQKVYTGPDITKRYLKDRGESQRAREAASTEGTGQREADPFGNIRMLGAVPEPIRSDAQGAMARGAAPDKFATAREQARAKLSDMQAQAKSAGGKAVMQRAMDVMDRADKLPSRVARRLFDVVRGAEKISDIVNAVNSTHEMLPAREAAAQFDVDGMVKREDYNAIKSKGEMDSFLTQAAKRYAELDQKGKARTESETAAYDRLDNLLRDKGAHGSDLGMMYDGLDKGERTDDAVRAMLAKSAPEVADRLLPKDQADRAGAGSGEKQSLEGTRDTRMTDKTKRKLDDYFDTVIGPDLKRSYPELADMAHAGDYDPVKDAVRVSVHALNPMTTAYHESLHAFFKRLMDQGNGKVADVLKRVATTEHVLRQMRELLKASPEAVKQLADPEEAAAYMYQFHQAGVLKGLVPEAKNVFQRIANMVKKALGIWRDDQRAEEIMRYFSEGEFKADASDPNAVAKALLESGHNQIIDKAREMTRPLLDVAQAIAQGTGARLRASQSQSMRDVADLIMRQRHDKGADPGFIPASRHRRTVEMNRIAQELRDVSQESMQEALEAMQSGQKAGLSADAQRVLDVVQGPEGVLPRMRAYMKAAGVDVSGFQPNPNYFPRVYDTDAISRNQEAFKDVLKKYGVADAQGIMNKLTANEGNSFAVVDRPGMQFLKERKLANIPDHELARFMRKDLMSVMSSYITQGTRRAEWARRFGDDNAKFDALLKQAKKEGASDKELETAQKAMRAADGTLGDDGWLASPKMRRLQGNMLVYQNLRLLPLMIFSNAVDPMGIVVRGGTVKDAWGAYKRTFSEVRQAWKKEYKADADTKLAEMIGTIDDSSLAHAMSDTYMQGMVGDKGKAINSALFRYNFTEATNRAMRVAGTKAAIAFIERHADGKGPHSERYLAELGLKPGEWDGDLTKDANKAAVMRWVDSAVLRPEAMDTPLWMSDPRYMLFAHLKRFVYAFQETVLKRVVHEMKHGNYTPAMALASYVPIMIAADAAKGMVLGGGSQPNWKQDWGPADYIASGVQRAGLLGIGQFALDAAQGNIGSLSGPTMEQLILDPIKMAYGRESPRTYVEDALPAHALYQGFVDPKEAKADPAFSD